MTCLGIQTLLCGGTRVCHFGCTYLTGSRSSLAFSDFVIFWAIWGLICDNYRRSLNNPGICCFRGLLVKRGVQYHTLGHHTSHGGIWRSYIVILADSFTSEVLPDGIHQDFVRMGWCPFLGPIQDLNVVLDTVRLSKNVSERYPLG